MLNQTELRIHFRGISNLPTVSSQPLLWVLRHAERHPIIHPGDAEKAGLTPAGQKAAFEFGQTLAGSYHLDKVYASPVGRCMHTAQQILHGGGQPVHHAQELPVLHFDCNFWNIPNLAGIYLNDITFEERLSNPEAPLAQEIAQIILRHLPFPTSPGSMNVAVTHDVIITLLSSVLLKMSNTSHLDYPSFLQGICLCQNNDSFQIL